MGMNRPPVTQPDVPSAPSWATSLFVASCCASVCDALRLSDADLDALVGVA